MEDEAFLQAIAYLTNADSLIITAGAGMGIDSGLPDFRGKQGFWNAYPALGQAKIAFTDIANPDAFRRKPDLAWGFYGHRLNMYRTTKPHFGFEILKKWGKLLPKGYFVITSNVDGQFQKGGFNSDRIVEYHGSIHFLQCSTPCNDSVWSASELIPVIDTAKCLWKGELPKCPTCNGLIRPNILMFNDESWVQLPNYSEQYQFYSWFRKLSNPVIIELGAGTHISTIRRLGEQFNVPLIRINPSEHLVSKNYHVGIKMNALEALVKLDNLLKFTDK